MTGWLTRSRTLAAALLVSVLLVAGGWLWAHLALRGIAQPLVVHWSDEAGIDQLGNPWYVAGIGFWGLVVLCLNFLIAFHLEERDRFLARLVAAVTVFFSVLLFVGFAAIISVN